MCLNTFTWLQSKDVNGDPVDNPKLALIGNSIITKNHYLHKLNNDMIL